MTAAARPAAARPAATYRHLGLAVRSEVPLPAPLDDAAPDLHVRVGPDRAVPAEPPPGVPVARYRHGDDVFYTASAHEGGHVLRFHRRFECVVAPDLRSVTCHTDPGTDPALLPVLVAGTLVAFVLSLRGQCVLHASAVGIGDGGLAFVGASGMGKSTLAALLCAAGARLVTDDVLPLSVGAEVRCTGGARELRLREKAASIAGQFDEAPAARETSDGRLAISPGEGAGGGGDGDGCRLDAFVVPLPSRDIDAVRVERLTPVDATFALVGYPRILEWSLDAVNRVHFETCAAVAGRVPVFRAYVPWGPPFRRTVAVDLARAVGLPLPETTAA